MGLCRRTLGELGVLPFRHEVRYRTRRLCHESQETHLGSGSNENGTKMTWREYNGRNRDESERSMTVWEGGLGYGAKTHQQTTAVSVRSGDELWARPDPV